MLCYCYSAIGYEGLRRALRIAYRRPEHQHHPPNKHKHTDNFIKGLLLLLLLLFHRFLVQLQIQS